MHRQAQSEENNRCTLIETTHGTVKLIRRDHDVYPTLITCNFSSLDDCLKYVEKNRFEINIIHSGKKRTRGELRNPKGS